MAFLCVSKQGELKNTIKTKSEKSLSKTFYKKIERGGGGGAFYLLFSATFLAVSLHEELKHIIK
jgi:hypothetical protein